MSTEQEISRWRRFWVLGILPFVAGCLFRLLDWTWRFRETGRQHLDAALADGRPVLVAALHGRLFAVMLTVSRFGKGRWLTMASKSLDGEAIARMLERFGLEIVRGSSARGGAGAVLAMIRGLRRPGAAGAALTVDGSRGPRGRVQGGVVQIASRTGGRIVPMTASARPAWIARGSWDRSLLPKPFARVDLVYGEPIEVPSKLDADGVASLSAEVEERLVQLQRVADELSGFGDDEPVQAPT